MDCKKENKIQPLNKLVSDLHSKPHFAKPHTNPFPSNKNKVQPQDLFSFFLKRMEKTVAVFKLFYCRMAGGQAGRCAGSPVGG